MSQAPMQTLREDAIDCPSWKIFQDACSRRRSAHTREIVSTWFHLILPRLQRSILGKGEGVQTLMTRLACSRGFYVADFGTAENVHTWVADVLQSEGSGAIDDDVAQTSTEDSDVLELKFVHQDSITAHGNGDDSLSTLHEIMATYDTKTHFVVQLVCSMTSQTGTTGELDSQEDQDFMETVLVPFYPLPSRVNSSVSSTGVATINRNKRKAQ